MKLRFVGDAFYNGELKHSKGKVVFVDNKLGEADRWIRRGLAVVAEEVKEEPVVEEPVVEEPVVEEPVAPQEVVKPKRTRKNKE